jgi:3-oxoacyl-[acyl-carrier protein] reductase
MEGILYFIRLTASKEGGGAIEINGKKVALGVPGPDRPQTDKPDPKTYPFIPLARGGSPDEAASAVLL